MSLQHLPTPQTSLTLIHKSTDNACVLGTTQLNPAISKR
jgi:hypothetical protein